MATSVVEIGWLERVMGAALESCGLPVPHCADVIEGISFAALRGIDTHGVPLLQTYLHELASGRARAKPRLSFRQQRTAIAHLDADGALGMVAGFEATRKTLELARANGVGAVSVANSNHFGAASVFAAVLARAGLIGLSFSNSDALVVPTNGRNPMLGTNPIGMAVQGEGGDLFCVDLATSQGSFLKSLALRDSGAQIPPGVLVDADGADVALSGEPPRALLPLGGHKGQCLGMLVSILCGLLAGGPFDWELVNLFDAPFEQPRRIAHLIVGIEIEAVADSTEFRARLSRYLRAFRSSPGSGAASVIAPGDLERETAARRRREGIPVRVEDYTYLRRLERELGLDQGTAGGETSKHSNALHST